MDVNFILVSIIALAGTTVMAILWMAYLIKIVMNDEELRERIRRIHRHREEQLRAQEDRIRKRNAQMGEVDDMLREPDSASMEA
jgi:hypothetical protein